MKGETMNSEPKTVDWTKPIQLPDETPLEYCGMAAYNTLGIERCAKMPNGLYVFRREDGTSVNGGPRIINTPPEPVTIQPELAGATNQRTGVNATAYFFADGSIHFMWSDWGSNIANAAYFKNEAKATAAGWSFGPRETITLTMPE